MVPVIFRRVAACAYSPGRPGSRSSVCQSIVMPEAPNTLWPQTRKACPVNALVPGRASQATASATSCGKPPWPSELMRRPASRRPNGMWAVIWGFDKTGRHRIDADAPCLQQRCPGLRQPDQASLARGVVGLPAIAGDAADRGQQNHPSVVAQGADLSSNALVNTCGALRLTASTASQNSGSCWPGFCRG